MVDYLLSPRGRELYRSVRTDLLVGVRLGSQLAQGLFGVAS